MTPSDSQTDPGLKPDRESLSARLEEAHRIIAETEEIGELGRWEWDLQTDTIQGSDHLFHIFGLDPKTDQLSRRTFLELVVPEDRTPLLKVIEAVQRDDKPQRAKFRVRRPDQTVRWAHARGHREVDSRGVPIRMVGTLRDATEQERVEAELRTSEALYRKLFEQAGVGVVEVEITTGRLVRVNHKFCEILGRTEEELTNLTVSDLTHPDDRKASLEKMKALKEGGIKQFSIEKRYIRGDGTSVWVDLTASPLWEPGEEVQYSVAVAKDTTERKRTQEALEESERTLRELVEHIKGIFWVHDVTERKTIYVSPAYETIWGKSPEALYEDVMEWGRGVHPDDREGLVERFFRLTETGGGDLLEYRIIRPDGEIRWLWDRAFVIRNDAGKVVRVAGIAEDITDRKREEEERHLLQAKIQHSQKLESLGVLAGGIAHDFNNLLMAILGNADLALSSLPPESPGREYVERIDKTAQQAAGLTNQMLAYSGKGRFLIQSIKLDQLVGEMAHLLETVISKKVNLVFDFASDLPAVEADASQLRQIVMNLITNGSEALGEESGTLKIATGTVEADRAYLSRCYLGEEVQEGEYVVLEVSDTGCGMDEETQRRIFDPFFTTKFTGRGLGLAAAQGIVRGHGGTIAVYSEPTMGTTVKVLFPIAIPSPEPPPVSVEPRTHGPTGGTILVVEDDGAVMDVTSRMLSKAGFEVLQATNGQEGVDAFSRDPDAIALVILDMTMPVMDGEEAFQEMKKIRPNLPVILCSGYNEQDATNRFVGKGLAGFIQKPYRSRDLLDRVDEVLKGS